MFLSTMGIELYGSQQSRSPLVSWYLGENKIAHTMKPPQPSNHPFGQIPFLADDGGVEVFESGAILLYLAQAHGPDRSPARMAADTSWVVWANSELDGLCFGKGMSGSQLDQPGKTLDTLESILELKRLSGAVAAAEGRGDEEGWLCGDFGVADCAVGSYLNYVPVFFPNVNPGSRPNICSYMLRCAERTAFSEAFGAGHAGMIREKAPAWLQSGSSSSGGGGGGGFFDKLMGK